MSPPHRDDDAPAAPPAARDCERKHAAWAGLIIGAVLLLCAGTFGYVRWCAADTDGRLRLVEQTAAVNAARFEAIRESLARLEKAVDRAADRAADKGPDR